MAAFDGGDVDPANGRRMGEGVLAYTPCGETAYALAGREGHERVRRSDEQGVAPSAETIVELFGGGPATGARRRLACAPELAPAFGRELAPWRRSGCRRSA